MKKHTKSILVSSLLAVAFGAMSVGTTFALFTSETKTTINVESGIVDVKSELTNPTLYSASATYTTGDVAGTLTGAFAGTYYYEPQPGLMFANGGSVSLENSILGIQKMTPGDKVSGELGFVNNSNVNIKYRFVVNTSSDSDDVLLSNMVFKVLGETYVGLKNMKTNWMELGALEAISGTTLEVILPLEAGNENQNKTASYAFSVEAVQANAQTTDDAYVSYVTSTYIPLDSNEIDSESKLTTQKVVEAPLPNAQSESEVVTVTVPTNAKLNDGASSLTLYVENLGEDEDYQGISIEVDQGAENYEVTLEGLDETNTQPVEVSINLGYQPLAVYHTHGNVTTSVPFSYNSDTGITTFSVTNFSEFTFVRDTNIIEVPNLAKLKIVRDYVNAGHSLAGKTVMLLADLDLGGEEWTPIGTSEHPFKGVFDGQGKTIKNFKIETNCDNHGLFGHVNSDTTVLGTGYNSLDGYWSDDTKTFDYSSFESTGLYTTVIKNLTVENATITETQYKAAAAVVGSAQHAYFENINVKKSTINGFKGAAGIIGSMGDCVINDCHVDAQTTVHASEYHGAGIVALNNNSSMYGKVYLACVILHCTNDANVTSTKGNIGGIIGSAQNGSVAVIDCVNNGDIEITGDGSQYISGLIGGGNLGSFHQYLIDSINNGDVSGNTSKSMSGAITYCAVKAVNVVNNGDVTGTPQDSMAGIGAGSSSWSEYVGCVNNGTLTNNKPNGTTYEINDDASIHIVSGVLADTNALNEYISNVSEAYIKLECTVTDNTGTLIIPNSVTNIYSENKVCSAIYLDQSRTSSIAINLPDISYEYNGAHTIWFNCPNSNILVPENITVPLLSVYGLNTTVTIRGDVNGGVVTYGPTLVENYGDISYINLRGPANTNIVFNNYGTIGQISSPSTQSVSTTSQVNLTINNHGSIVAANNYALLFYGNSTVIFNAYATSTMTKADGVGIMAINNGSSAHARLVTINVEEGAAGVSGNAYYGAKAYVSPNYDCALVINFNVVLP